MAKRTEFSYYRGFWDFDRIDIDKNFNKTMKCLNYIIDT